MANLNNNDDNFSSNNLPQSNEDVPKNTNKRFLQGCFVGLGFSMVAVLAIVIIGLAQTLRGGTIVLLSVHAVSGLIVYKISKGSFLKGYLTGIIIFILIFGSCLSILFNPK
ncbi:MAG: hypothetical protein LWX56_14000 [Ignavibacteria bacterium]|nr:hypothetical protein [Ignavibacteria bacterium]